MINEKYYAPNLTSTQLCLATVRNLNMGFMWVFVFWWTRQGRRGRGRHTASKFRIAITMEIAVEDRQICNITTVFKRLKTFSQRRRVDEADFY